MTQFVHTQAHIHAKLKQVSQLLHCGKSFIFKIQIAMLNDLSVGLDAKL